ncbi:MAG: endonuclease MutS2 [Syntrophaceae bacterium]|nr:endonuclease MutS2 [Syntrophaceae bacterium]
MDDRSLKALEYDHVLERLKSFSISPLGRRRCEALRPSRDLSWIESRLAEVMEMKGILETLGDLPIRGLKDIGEILKKLEIEGAVLDVQELLDLHNQIRLCEGLRRFFLKSKTGEPARLREKVSRFSSLKVLEREILRAIHPKGEILDRASSALSEIRLRLSAVRERAKGVLEHLLHQEELQPIFQEQFITLRNGRYVLLIKSDFKHRLEGIIHDQSQSRMSFFLEPFQVVGLNNEINVLMAEEKEEEYRILADLSEKARSERQNLWRDLDILGELDLLYAMARFSILLKGVKPILNEKGRIDMMEARNPILVLQREDQVVPIHLRMGDGVRCLILSGANAGGKTVALKTLGLLTLMAQSGLPIPVAEGSEVAVFQAVFAVIGDEQNVEENLSTFSSHLLHLNQIVREAGPGSLLLLDELGVGTHASEGCALAMGFLDRFMESGASVVVTTHFDRLKVYGYLHREVENVAVEFDEESLEPKYTLAYGSSGMSNAFLVAEKLGVSRDVLEMARQYLEGSERDLGRTLEELERLKADERKLQQRLLAMNEEVGLERQRLKGLIEKIRMRREEILSRAEERVRKAVQRAEEELKEWVRQKKERPLPNRRQLPGYRKELKEIKERFIPPIKKAKGQGMQAGFKAGERVKILSLRTQGILVGIDEPLNQVEVMTERAKVKTTLSDIIKVAEGDEVKGFQIPKFQPLSQGEGQGVPVELKVIGLTVEDALPKVDKFIDQALLHGLEKIHIIHGVGSGRLRDAIGKYLQGHRAVKHFSPGEGTRGGRGITVVELR